MIKLTDEEKETLSYDDVAYKILTETNKKIKIQDLFKKVINLMDLDDEVFENQIGEFFELIVTDKRFTMLDGGYCDLKINHTSKMIIDDDDDDYIISEENEEEEEFSEEEDSYDDESNPDETDNDLQDLVVIDEDSEDIDADLM